MKYLARVTEDGRTQLLKDHLTEVAEMCKLRSPLKFQMLAYYMGLFHDLGKYLPKWQQYLTDTSPNKTRVYHSHQGSYLVNNSILQNAIASHHGKLHHSGYFETQDYKQHEPTLIDCVKNAKEDGLNIPDDININQLLTLAIESKKQWNRTEVATRMLYSQLVDTDRLNAQYFQEGKKWELTNLKYSCQFVTPKYHTSPIDGIRREFNRMALSNLQETKSILTLTGATGIGKTDTVFQYAHQYCQEHNKKGIIYVAPLNNILSQTESRVKGLFPGEPVLADYGDIAADAKESEDSNRLRSELRSRWDCPIVLTSMVQFLESLFSNSAGKVRKLQGLINKVVIIDEVQQLPMEHIKPILDVFNALRLDWDVTFIFSTATQPIFTRIETQEPLEFQLIVPKEKTDEFALRLQRTKLEFLPEQTIEEFTDFITEKIKGVPSAIACFNTKKASQKALFMLKNKVRSHEVIYLSGSLHVNHKKRVLHKVSRMMDEGKPVLLVCTQIVEAGVNLDFHVGFRQYAPYPNLLQLEGRINRHGLRSYEDSILYVCNISDTKNLPQYDRGNSITSAIAKGSKLTSDAYYSRFLGKTWAGDVEKINESRERSDFPKVSEFKVIKDSETVIVLLEETRDYKHKPVIDQCDRAYLNGYSVSVHSSTFGNIEEWDNGLKVWVGGYDSECGILSDIDIAWVV